MKWAVRILAPLLVSMLLFTQAFASQAKSEQYEEGYADGRTKGYAEGYSARMKEEPSADKSYEEGYEDGRTKGYAEGYSAKMKEEPSVDKNDNSEATIWEYILLVLIAGAAAWAGYAAGRKSGDEARRIEITQKAERTINEVAARKKKDIDFIFSRNDRLREAAINETIQNFPYLTVQLADIQTQFDEDVVNYLQAKDRPALKAAEEVARVSREKRGLYERCKQLQYQINFYESVFPWLEEFKEIPIKQAWEYSQISVEGGEYDVVRNWLSPEEYTKLTNIQKFQLALDRWKNRKKTAWDIGIEFERYIGYQLEQRGYRVRYTGATMGLEDMGRDLIAQKDGLNLVIQCKRWSEYKVIHEKHICQLYGSVAVLASQNKQSKYKGVFITTTVLSETARMFAEYSNIECVENCPIGEYPLIKCNVSKSGEKIYHLPFDQQYDRIVISEKRGEFYAWTVEEAESRGFRRAFRWRPEG